MDSATKEKFDKIIDLAKFRLNQFEIPTRWLITVEIDEDGFVVRYRDENWKNILIMQDATSDEASIVANAIEAILAVRQANENRLLQA